MMLVFKITILITILSTESSACRNAVLTKTGVTEQEKYDILETHNRLRQSVAMGQVRGQPGAENMMEMKWDNELAAKAQKWASECTFEHDPNRYSNRFTMGQNLAIMWSTEPLGEHEGDFPSRIQNWFNEVNDYGWGSSWSPKTGHYSQLVWGETNLVGCGFSSYYDGYKYNKLWVCNYGPGGNVVGVDPYSTGSPSCQSYGLSTSSRWPGLCDKPGLQQTISYQPPQQNYITNYNQGNYVAQHKTESYQPPQQNYITNYNEGKYVAPHKAEYTRVTYKPQQSSFSNQLADFSWNQPSHQYYQEPQPVHNAYASFQPKADRSNALLTYNWDAFFN